MKKYIKYILIAVVLSACNNNDDNKPPIEQLPPMTTTGENTIGCLVNGEPFTDRGLMNNFYQFVDGKFSLVINWGTSIPGNIESGQIEINNIEIEQGETYILNFSDFVEDNFTGGGGTYTIINNETSGQFETNQNFTGFITFTRFDTNSNIMSGTFEFQAKEISNEDTITLTDGRFDLTFTN